MNQSRRANSRSYPCNVDLLVSLRERKGWTQQKLAAISGYSERLINKAESGRSISSAAIEILAETLSTEEDPIYFEDLISDPIALAKEFMAGIYVHQKNVVTAIRHFLDEDIVFRLAGDPATIPFAGEHRGFAAVERAFEIFFSIMEAPPNYDYKAGISYLAQGKDVIVWGESWLHPIGVPMDKPMPISHRLTFHKGKLVLFENVFDTLHAAKVLGERRLE